MDFHRIEQPPHARVRILVTAASLRIAPCIKDFFTDSLLSPIEERTPIPVTTTLLIIGLQLDFEKGQHVDLRQCI